MEGNIEPAEPAKTNQEVQKCRDRATLLAQPGRHESHGHNSNARLCNCSLHNFGLAQKPAEHVVQNAPLGTKTRLLSNTLHTMSRKYETTQSMYSTPE